MSFGLCYWILMLLWLVLGARAGISNWKAHVPNVILFVLLTILGWAVFGPALHK